MEKNEMIFEKIKKMWRAGKNLGIKFDYNYIEEAIESKDDTEYLEDILSDMTYEVVDGLFNKLSEEFGWSVYKQSLEDSGFGLFHRDNDFNIEYYPFLDGIGDRILVYVTLRYGVGNKKDMLWKKYSKLASRLNDIDFELLRFENDPTFKEQWDIQPREYVEVTFQFDERVFPDKIKNLYSDLRKLTKVLLEWVSQFEY